MIKKMIVEGCRTLIGTLSFVGMCVSFPGALALGIQGQWIFSVLCILMFFPCNYLFDEI